MKAPGPCAALPARRGAKQEGNHLETPKAMGNAVLKSQGASTTLRRFPTASLLAGIIDLDGNTWWFGTDGASLRTRRSDTSECLATLRYCVAASEIRIYQGHYGAESAKPKDLLSINLVTLSRRLEEFKLYMNIPKGVTVGKGEQSEFLTGRLKEYPPMLNKALANSFSDGLSDRLCIDDGMELTATFAEVCRKLVLSNFSQTMGLDFAG